MPHMVKIYTKKGDEGQTSLFGGQRISKSDPRPEAFGTLDEVCAILGVARAAADNPDLQAVIHSIQEDLFLLGAELATAPEDRPRLSVAQITPAHTARLESLIDERLAKIELPRAFIIPGSSSYIPALLDWARAVLRRAERRVVELREAGLLDNAEVLKYLNRLADLLFVLARYQEAQEGKGAVQWRGRR
ncbi:MAG: ATP/cobalamin adenosyltransferase [Candidatus Rokubacteria bacterium CSP1-6]|nr:MAG: ATP/cobalamin adenosyltransferase [Candidatus Rokubacteria bacterium CSP1-6]